MPSTWAPTRTTLLRCTVMPRRWFRQPVVTSTATGRPSSRPLPLGDSTIPGRPSCSAAEWWLTMPPVTNAAQQQRWRWVIANGLRNTTPPPGCCHLPCAMRRRSTLAETPSSRSSARVRRPCWRFAAVWADVSSIMHRACASTRRLGTGCDAPCHRNMVVSTKSAQLGSFSCSQPGGPTPKCEVGQARAPGSGSWRCVTLRYRHRPPRHTRLDAAMRGDGPDAR